jgi:PPOX class probable F420-dependent enzyme
VTSLGAERFVSLTTFRKNGQGVPTQVWVVQDGDALVVWTPSDSYKVARVRNDTRVELVPCGRQGTPRAGEVPVAGSAEVIDDPAAVDRIAGLLKQKYGFEFRVITTIERIAARRRKPRVLLRITF